MAQHISLIEDIQNQVVKQEGVYHNIKSLNKDGNIKDSRILYVNVRSINHNFDKLEILIKRLKLKPYVIVCAESWNIDNIDLYKLQGFKTYYNESKLNKSDGVIIYINDCVKETTEIVQIGNLKLLNSKIFLNNNINLIITALYRSQDMSCLEFNMNLKKFLNDTKNYKNHLIIGDFNIDILKQNIISEDF